MPQVSQPPSPAWLTDPEVLGLFEAFPLALVLLSPNTQGSPLANARFRELFGEANLRGGPLAGITAMPGLQWQSVALPDRDGNPLQIRAQALRTPGGVMLVIDDTPTRIDVGELASLRARIAELEHLSTTDRLTGCWNRSHLDRTVESEIARSLRMRQPLSLVLIDIDHFKRVNDTHGHAAGDIVLRELVVVMRTQVRAGDMVFRWGGEEFVVLAPSTSYTAAAQLAEKLRVAVHRHTFPYAGLMTVSAGVAEHVNTESAAAWFERVDAQLYAAKNGGRNRVCVDPRGSSDAWSATPLRSALRLQWRDEYACGNAVIDAQHRELFDLANALLDVAAVPGFDATALRVGFHQLLEHVERHFRDEEALLAARGYPLLEGHARAHAHLYARAVELGDAAAAGRIKFGELVEFLANDVIARHLFVADRDYFPLVGGEQTNPQPGH